MIGESHQGGLKCRVSYRAVVQDCVCFAQGHHGKLDFIELVCTLQTDFMVGFHPPALNIPALFSIL